MKKVGILGGTFDPIHIGHLIMADQAMFYADLDEIWFLPAPTPPHKLDNEITSIEQRIEMIKKVTSQDEKYKLCAIELNRTGPSYTIDTIKELKSIYPHFSFSFVIGGDMIEYLPHWHKVEELLTMVRFLGLERPGFSLTPKNELEEKLFKQVELIPMPQLEISSSQIREWIKMGRTIRYLVPFYVEQYIKENNLYADRN